MNTSPLQFSEQYHIALQTRPENRNGKQKYDTLEIKTFGLVLEFEMSFQQQQHSVVFMLLYSYLRDHFHFLNLGNSSNLIGAVKWFFWFVEQLWIKTCFNKLTYSCHFCLRGIFGLHEVGGKKCAHLKLDKFEHIQWNKVSFWMYGLAMIEIICQILMRYWQFF